MVKSIISKVIITLSSPSTPFCYQPSPMPRPRFRYRKTPNAIMDSITTHTIPATEFLIPPIALSSKICMDIVWGLYAIIRVAPSSPMDLIQAIRSPTSIPVLAKGKDTLMNTSNFLFPRTLAIVSYLSGIASNAASLKEEL